jgi:ubiquinone/menaquinone biosynthesis C-methylase UbiE
MMDMEQLNRFLDVLDLGKNSKVLDLGCGIGTISEYLSDVTGAHITGLDLASGAIERAKERCESKRDRLTFLEGNMNDLQLEPSIFDTIIAIDTLYFVSDLNTTVAKMKEIITPNGQMGIFFSSMVSSEKATNSLHPQRTRLANALRKCCLRFQTWDFTENEKSIWRKQKQVAKDLKDEFEAEGAYDIYNGRVNEAEYILRYVETDRMSRYLYHVSRDKGS